MAYFKTWQVDYTDSSGKVLEQITIQGYSKKEAQDKAKTFKKKFLTYYDGRCRLKPVLTLIAKI